MTVANDIARVLVVGGGAAGTLVAAALLDQAEEPVEVVVAERHGEVGLGLAYGTDDPLHRLNVPASGMSAWAGDPHHFVRWSGLPPAAFAPRALYGRYLQDVLVEAQRAARPGASLARLPREVVDLTDAATSGVTRRSATLDDGSRLPVDVVVLATGNAPPAALPGLDPALHDDPRIVPDPWAPGALEQVPPGSRVLAIGTGLTFVDVALTLTARDPDTCVDGLSRHGLLPRAHRLDDRPRRTVMPPADLRLSTLIRWLRAADDDVLDAVDALRPETDRIWRGWSASEQSSFLRHAARRWEVLRHRMAPDSAVRLASLIRDGRVAILSGSVTLVSANGSGVTATLADGRRLDADTVVACTGPASSLRRPDEPLVGRLVDRGLARVGPHGLGLDVEPRTGVVRDAKGRSDASLLAMGGLRRGVLWETTAVPELRVQADHVADYVLERVAREPAGRRPRAG